MCKLYLHIILIFKKLILALINLISRLRKDMLQIRNSKKSVVEMKITNCGSICIYLGFHLCVTAPNFLHVLICLQNKI